MKRAISRIWPRRTLPGLGGYLPAMVGWLVLALQGASAETFGNFTYEVVDDEITITAHPWLISDPIEIPEQIEGKPVTRIGETAFRWSRSPGITIPDSVKAIEESAFDGCRNLTSIDLPDNLTTIGRLAFRSTPITSLEIPAGVTVISEFAFHSCWAISSLTLPPHLIEIEGGAFGSCDGLTEVIIPPSVEVIGPGVFLGCDGLTVIEIPSGVSTIGAHAFSHCEALVAINVDPANAGYRSVDGILMNKSGTELIRCPEGRTSPFDIPAGVELLHDWAFLRCWGLEGVTLPDSVTTIGEWAFRDCRTITNLTIPAGVTQLGPAALSDCPLVTAFQVDPDNDAFVAIEGVIYSKDLTRVVACPPTRAGHYEVPATVTEIGPYGFYNCAELTSIRLPAGLQSIGERAFRSCRLLEMEFPPGLQYIGPRSFSGCHQLTRVDIPSGVTAIPEKAFEFCRGLTTLTLPATLTEIGVDAFQNCSAFTEVRIPSSVQTIAEDAFFACDNLARAEFGGDAPTGGRDVFDDVAAGFEVLYLSGATGFDQSPWHSYRRRTIDQSVYPMAGWLIDHQQPHEADFSSDLNGDGVPLLFAYALALHPRENLQHQLPVPQVTGEELALSFHGAAPEIDYCVEVSENLTDWTGTGVTLSDLDAELRRTATAVRSSHQLFMRLRVKLRSE